MSLTKKTASSRSPFMKQLRKWGLIAAGIGSAIIAAPVALPTIIVAAGGYLAVAGGIAMAATAPNGRNVKGLFSLQ